jgi:hypothetical protein
MLRVPAQVQARYTVDLALKERHDAFARNMVPFEVRDTDFGETVQLAFNLQRRLPRTFVDFVIAGTGRWRVESRGEDG